MSSHTHANPENGFSMLAAEVIDLTLETPDDAVAGEPLRPRRQVIDLTDDNDHVPVFGSARPVCAGGSHAVAGEPRRPFKHHDGLKCLMLLNGYTNNGEAETVMQKLDKNETKDLQYLSLAEIGSKLSWETTDKKFERLWSHVNAHYRAIADYRAHPIRFKENLTDFLSANGLQHHADRIKDALDIHWSDQLQHVDADDIQKHFEPWIGAKLLILRTFVAEDSFKVDLPDDSD